MLWNLGQIPLFCEYHSSCVLGTGYSLWIETLTPAFHMIGVWSTASLLFLGIPCCGFQAVAHFKVFIELR